MNNIKIALRNIQRHKAFSFVNISGLAVGLAAVILIFLYVHFESSFDQFHANSDRIYRVVKIDDESGLSSSMPAPLAPAMKNEFPEIEQIARFSFKNNVHITANDKNFFEDSFVFTDPAAFNIFSVEFLKGSPERALKKPFSILLSESMASKYFGLDNPIGKTIIYKGSQEFEVTGVIKDLPENSSFSLNFVAPFTTLEKLSKYYKMDSWGAFSYQTSFLLAKDANPINLQPKLQALIEKNLGEKISEFIKLTIQPLDNIYFESKRTMIFVFITIATLILLIACINYINLTTANSVGRIKEIGIRKVVGADRSKLIHQFLGETMIFTLISFLFAIVLVAFLLPSFDAFVGKNLSKHLNENRQFLLLIFGIVIFVGLFSGFYPAMVISSKKIVSTLRGDITGIKGSKLRSALVIFQFVICIILLVSTFSIKEQLQYIFTKDLGFQKNNIIAIDIRDKRFRTNIEFIQNELKRNSNILQVSASEFLPNFTDMATTIHCPGTNIKQEPAMYLNFADESFIELYKMDIVDGRNFSKKFPSDLEGAFILNETAVKMLGWESAIGKELTHDIGRRSGKVVGVVKDFHMNPLYERIEPLCIDFNPSKATTFLSVSVTGSQSKETLKYIQNLLNKLAPDYPFVYQYFDDIVDKSYAFENKLEFIFSLFSFLAIIIATLGLLSLVSYTVKNRTKEIGIRKVFGATISGVLVLLSKKFIKWILIANIIAFPIAWFAMNEWLKGFAYRIELSMGLFLVSGFFALMIAVLTIGLQTLKAATANPVESLRYE